MTLEELNIQTTGAAAIIRYFKELLNSIDTEESLDDLEAEELYNTLWSIFPQFRDTAIRYKCFVLWSDEDGAEVHILDTPEEVSGYIANAEQLFKEYPIPNSNDPETDEFKRKCRFAAEVSLEQLRKLAGDEFDNPNNFRVDETGLTFTFEDYVRVFESRAKGLI